MDNLSAAKKRLHDLIATSGLAADDTRLEKMQAALEPLSDWLRAGSIADFLAATQLLMLDPLNPGCHRTPEVEVVGNAVRAAWISAGNAGSVRGLQLLLLAVWPLLANKPSASVPQLVRVAQRCLGRSTESLKEVEDWFSRVNDFQGSSRKAFDGSATKRALNLNEDTDEDDDEDAYKEDRELIEEVEVAVEALRAELSQFKESWAVRPGLQWWGQSAYSPTAGTPYRRLSESDRLACAVLEASEFIDNAPFSPLAAYVGEVLNTLGDAWDDKKSVKGWLRMLNDSHERLTGLTKPASFTGLPVLALVHGVPLDDLAEQTRLDLDTEIDRLDWITWVLGEVILGKALAE